MDKYNEIFAEKSKIMCIFAHPDDAEIYAGGTIARLRKDGKNVTVVKVTSGNRGSRQEKISTDKLANLRKTEDAKAMDTLGIDPSNNIYLDLEDGGVEDTIENIEKIVKLIREFKPDLIITHNPESVIIRHSEGVNWVNHRDHMNTGKIATYAGYPYSRDISFFPEHFETPGLESHATAEFLYVDYWGHEDEIKIDITDFYNTKVDSIAAHASQYSKDHAKSSADFFTKEGDSNKYSEKFRWVVAD